ncbi:MAG: hypothetical protein GX660_13165 [Clostridiaceae bacterium]|nr:hypothetical protein [Clostridiaceae bacterium]
MVPGKRKAMSIFEKDMVWLYINNAEEFQQKRAIVHSKGDRRAYDAVVVFKDIEEKQIKNMRYRKKIWLLYTMEYLIHPTSFSKNLSKEMVRMDAIKNNGRIFALLQYLYKNTDEDHNVTNNELIEILLQAGYTANRKTIKDDIDIIVEVGFDIITVKSSTNSFFVGDRTFELPELKYLVDNDKRAYLVTTDIKENMGSPNPKLI